MISFDDLTVRYGDATALRGVTGLVSDGEWLGVIGPNGAGKTTLLNALGRLVPYVGSITVCGQQPAGSAGVNWPGSSPTCRSGRCSPPT